MNYQDAAKYWFVAREKFYPEAFDGFSGSQKLAELLGLPYPDIEHYSSIEMTPELKRILEALAGPYGQVIRKMLEARKGLKNDPRGS
jgi:hypothetical protein